MPCSRGFILHACEALLSCRMIPEAEDGCQENAPVRGAWPLVGPEVPECFPADALGALGQAARGGAILSPRKRSR